MPPPQGFPRFWVQGQALRSATGQTPPRERPWALRAELPSTDCQAGPSLSTATGPAPGVSDHLGTCRDLRRGRAPRRSHPVWAGDKVSPCGPSGRPSSWAPTLHTTGLRGDSQPPFFPSTHGHQTEWGSQPGSEPVAQTQGPQQAAEASVDTGRLACAGPGQGRPRGWEPVPTRCSRPAGLQGPSGHRFQELEGLAKAVGPGQVWVRWVSEDGGQRGSRPTAAAAPENRGQGRPVVGEGRATWAARQGLGPLPTQASFREQGCPERGPAQAVLGRGVRSIPGQNAMSPALPAKAKACQV